MRALSPNQSYRIELSIWLRRDYSFPIFLVAFALQSQKKRFPLQTKFSEFLYKILSNEIIALANDFVGSDIFIDLVSHKILYIAGAPPMLGIFIARSLARSVKTHFKTILHYFKNLVRMLLLSYSMQKLPV